MPRRIICLLARNSDLDTARQMSLVVGGLSQQGNSVTACVWNGARAFPHDLQFRSGSECFDLNAAPRLDLSKLAKLAQMFRSSEPEVVHIWGNDRGLCYLSWYFARRAAFVQTCTPESKAVPGWISWNRSRSWVTVDWPSRKVRQRAIFIPPCAPSAVRPTAQSRSDTLEALNIPHDAVFIGTTSDGASHLRDLVWAMQLLQASNEKVHLLIWARREEHKYLRRVCHAWGVDNHFHFLDPNTRAACLVHLGVYWAGQTDWTGILESMAGATPVVAVSNLPHQKIIEDGVSGFLYPNANVGILARKSHLLLSDSARRRRMGEAARRQVTVQFPLDQTVRRYQVLYDDLLESKAARGKTIDKFAPLVR